MVALRNVRARDIAKAFTRDWVFTYGPPLTILSDNGPQFTAKFLLEVHRILSIHHHLSSGNEQANSALRNFTLEKPTDWDNYVDVLTYSYNTQPNESAGLSPFDIVLRRSPPSLYAEKPVADHCPPLETEKRWRDRLASVIQSASGDLHRRQQRYKQKFDAHMQMTLQPKAGPAHAIHLRQSVQRTSTSSTVLRTAAKPMAPPNATGWLRSNGTDFQPRSLRGNR